MKVKTMKIKMNDVVYEYEHVTIIVNTKDRQRIKMYSTLENLTMKDFVSKLLDTYENTSD